MRHLWVAALTALAVLTPASAAYAAGTTTTGADLQISGSASTGSPAPGAGYTYTFQVKNSGPDTATGVSFSDPLPTGTVYNYATANGSTLPCAAQGQLAGGATVVCSLGDIAKGAQATIVVSVNAPTTATTYPNTGSVTSTSIDPVTTNNAVTVTVQVKASNKNGVNDPATLPAAPCVTLNNLSAPTGYYLTFAAVWNTFSVKSCSSTTQDVYVHVTETNVVTGLNDYDVLFPVTLTGGQNQSWVLDNDYAPFNTTYTVTFTATDLSGNVMATGSVLTTTPPPQ